MTEKKFVNGMKVKTVKTQYGEIIKLDIDMEVFKTNPVKKGRYLNIDLLTNREGKKYAVINEYQKPVDAETVKKEFDGKEINDEEIPF